MLADQTCYTAPVTSRFLPGFGRKLVLCGPLVYTDNSPLGCGALPCVSGTCRVFGLGGTRGEIITTNEQGFTADSGTAAGRS